MKAALGLHPTAVIAPAPMLAVTLPPKLKCTVNVGCASVDRHSGHAAANIAGQGQIARGPTLDQ